MSLRGARRPGVAEADDVEELEEGEACPDDGDAFFDPDVALAYIDEKLQHVLGHFQKDFEGGFSAQNLGSKFGGYGSFLPTNQRSPSPLPQSGAPSMMANMRTSRSPYQPSAERMDQHHPSTVTVDSASGNNSAKEPSNNDLCKKERCSSTSGEEVSVAGSESMDTSFSDSDSKSQIKVGYENTLPRKNADIYSGLGLDVSTSSSMEESPDERGLSPEFSNVPCESPRTILQVMTCFPVPGGFFLSPLRGNILQLTKWETHLDIDNVPKALEGCSKSYLSPVDDRGHVAEKTHLDAEDCNFEGNTKSEHYLRLVSDSADLVLEKQISKHKNDIVYSNRGDVMERINTDSMFKNRRGIDQDKHKTSKKIKREHRDRSGRDWNHEWDLAGGEVPDEAKALRAKRKHMKGPGESGSIYLRKENVTSAYDLFRKHTSSDVDVPFHKEKKERAADVEALDMSCKKILKEQEENQLILIHCTSKRSKNEKALEKKSDILKSEEMASKMESRPGKVLYADKVLSSSGAHQHNELVTDNKLVSVKEDPPELWVNLPPRKALNSAEHSTDKKGWDIEGLSPQPNQHIFDERDIDLDASLNPIAHENKKSSFDQGCGPRQQLGMSFGGKEKSLPRFDDQVIQKSVVQDAHLPMKLGKQEISPTVPKMKAQLWRPNVENVVHKNAVRQVISNVSDACPISRDRGMVLFALKEARDLKHKANHLKNKGLELESTGLYFEAALKFLHVASLLETPNFESSRPGDAARSMKMYSETAKLCNFCAHEYERCQKVASAALAYKCAEVAYLKAAYYKHPGASKDRQELQAVVQIASGQSPPSSASDNDTINSCRLSKLQSMKDGISPQEAGNHLPSAVRNQAHLLRLLAYVNDVNCAFDATRKSQVVSAAGSQERGKCVDDDLASVKPVLDFHFNNVSELLRLVWLSMESISS
ncbi:hypothetical protein ACP4OV_005034 [Aristida adscensionis]